MQQEIIIKKMLSKSDIERIDQSIVNQIKDELLSEIKNFKNTFNIDFVVIGSTAAILNGDLCKNRKDIDIVVFKSVDKDIIKSQKENFPHVDVLNWEDFELAPSNWRDRVSDIDGIKIMSKKDILANMTCSIKKVNKISDIKAIIDNDIEVLYQYEKDLEQLENIIKTSSTVDQWKDYMIENINIMRFMSANNLLDYKNFTNIDWVLEYINKI